jgi:hypothetical protein
MLTSMESPAIILDKASSATTWLAKLTASYRDLQLTIKTQNSADLTVKIQISNQDKMPDFASPATATNEWEYVQIKDLQDGSAINGNVWVSFSWIDKVCMFEVNTNFARWTCATVTTYTAGNVTINVLWSNK